MLTNEQKNWRIRVFALTWLGYAAFYFCRKNFSVVMPVIAQDFDYSKDDFAIVISVYSFSYMLGQFINGHLSDRFGPRIIVSIGMVLSICANIYMGFSASIMLFTFLMGLNGFGQSSGWSGLVKNMTTWFRHSERGIVMSWWSTCYIVGSFLATIFATYWVTNETFFTSLSWKRGFWVPSLVLILVVILYNRLTRNKPSDVNIPPINDDGDPADDSNEKMDRVRLMEILNNSTLWIAAFVYFFLKLTRYAFLFWLPMYMTEALHYEVDSAGYLSSIYELAGFIGVIAAGYISDRLYNSRRFPIATMMLVGLAAVCLLHPYLSTIGMAGTAFGIALIGMMTYGPDSILSGAAAMDIGGKKGAATAAGIINGVGSFGQLISPFVVAYVSDQMGWDSLFYLFVVLGLMGAALSATKWNFGKVVH